MIGRTCYQLNPPMSVEIVWTVNPTKCYKVWVYSKFIMLVILSCSSRKSSTLIYVVGMFFFSFQNQLILYTAARFCPKKYRRVKEQEDEIFHFKGVTASGTPSSCSAWPVDWCGSAIQIVASRSFSQGAGTGWNAVPRGVNVAVQPRRNWTRWELKLLSLSLAIVQDISYLLTHFHLYTTLCLINLWIHNIPGTESLLEMIQAEEMQKRGRSDTLSTVFSDSHDQKGPEYMLYQSK